MPKLFNNPWKDNTTLRSKVLYRVRSLFYAWLLKRYCKGRKTVLDVGCGTGQFMKTAEKLGYKATGVELDERFRAKNVIISDFRKVKGKWDVVFSSLVLGSIPSHEDFIRKMCSLSHDIVITIAPLPSPSFWDTPDNIRPATKVEIRWLCRRYGFRTLFSAHIPFFKIAVVVSKKVTNRDDDWESRKIRQGFW
jgi:SAM-dependent methyltransferase